MRINIEQVRTVGAGLLRPEGVMAADDGHIYTADARGCCSRIAGDGSTSFFGTLGGTPNGICLDKKGNCIIANIGNGEVQLLSGDGSHLVLLTAAQGKRMYTPNFPFIDFSGRLWVSNSTDDPNIDSSLRSPVPDGCLVLIAENREPQIVADGICFANGVAVDQTEKYVYVAETMKRRILRFLIKDDSSLGAREVYGPEFLGAKGFPDGIAFDEAGNLWIAFPMANAIGFIDPAGKLDMYLEDPAGKILRAPANICFGGKDRKTAFIGSLGGTNIPCFEVPHSGARLIHQAG
jgi:sugar lactone lactonase YvrE